MVASVNKELRIEKRFGGKKYLLSCFINVVSKIVILDNIFKETEPGRSSFLFNRELNFFFLIDYQF